MTQCIFVINMRFPLLLFSLILTTSVAHSVSTTVERKKQEFKHPAVIAPYKYVEWWSIAHWFSRCSCSFCQFSLCQISNKPGKTDAKPQVQSADDRYDVISHIRVLLMASTTKQKENWVKFLRLKMSNDFRPILRLFTFVVVVHVMWRGKIPGTALLFIILLEMREFFF